jgi:hypothetical protein
MKSQQAHMGGEAQWEAQAARACYAWVGCSCKLAGQHASLGPAYEPARAPGTPTTSQGQTSTRGHACSATLRAIARARDKAGYPEKNRDSPP